MFNRSFFINLGRYPLIYLLMIKGFFYHDMRILEKALFAEKMLQIVKRDQDQDAEFALLVQDMEGKVETLNQALQKVSNASISSLVKKDDAQRDKGISNLRRYAQTCAARKNEAWASAGQQLVYAIKAVGWTMNRKGNKEETNLVDTLLNMLETHPHLKQAIETINAQEWVAEIREGQASYILHKEQQTQAKPPKSRVSSQEAARVLGFAIDKMGRYINFHIEFRNNETYKAMASSLNHIIAEFRATQKQHATRSRKKREGKSSRNTEE